MIVSVQGRFGINYSHQKDITAHSGGKISSPRALVSRRGDCTPRAERRGGSRRRKEGRGRGLLEGAGQWEGAGLGQVRWAGPAAAPGAAGPRRDGRGLPSEEAAGALPAGLHSPARPSLRGPGWAAQCAFPRPPSSSLRWQRPYIRGESLPGAGPCWGRVLARAGSQLALEAARRGFPAGARRRRLPKARERSGGGEAWRHRGPDGVCVQLGPAARGARVLTPRVGRRLVDSAPGTALPTAGPGRARRGGRRVPR